MNKNNAHGLIIRAANMLPLIFSTLFLFLVSSSDAFASGNDVMTKIINTFTNYPTFLYMGAYIIGIYFAITGLVGLKNSTENMSRHPIKSPIARLVIGGGFLAIGTMILYIVNSVEVTTAAITGSASIPKVEANTLGSMMISTMGRIGLIPVFLSVIAYFSAIYFVISGLLMLQAWFEDPGKNPISRVFMRIIGAGFLLTLPTVIGVVVNSIGGDNSKIYNCYNGGSTGAGDCNAWTVTGNTGGGLDNILANIVNNIAPPLMQYALPGFCYFAGIILIAVCLYRLAQASNDKSRAPGSFGTWTTLFTGAALLSVAHLIAMTRGTLFASGDVYNTLNFVSENPMDLQMQARAQNALSAVLVFLRIVGYISFVRGLFILRAFGEGRQGGSIMGAVTHITAGGMLANLGMLLKFIQNTTDIEVFDFTQT